MFQIVPPRHVSTAHPARHKHVIGSMMEPKGQKVIAHVLTTVEKEVSVGRLHKHVSSSQANPMGHTKEKGHVLMQLHVVGSQYPFTQGDGGKQLPMHWHTLPSHVCPVWHVSVLEHWHWQLFRSHL